MRLPLTLMLLAAATACATGPDTARVPGNISAGGTDWPVYTGPRTAVAGQAFSATVFTFGSSSCTTPDGADVTVTGLDAEVVPYDRVPAAPVACTADFGQHPHPVTLRFDTAGSATLRVRGVGFSIEGERLPLVDSVTILVQSP